MVFYYAYGSNMSEQRMLDRKITFFSRKFGILKDYKLVFNKISKSNNNISFANIVESIGDFVEGVIYEINEYDIKKLDKFEGYPVHYTRKNVIIDNISCVVYVAQNEWVKEGIYPTKEYINYLLEAKDMLSEDYYNKIKKII